jgi:hypothetical protein
VPGDACPIGRCLAPATAWFKAVAGQSAANFNRVSSRGAHPSPADRAPRRLIEIVDARGVRFLGEERKNHSLRDRIAIRQIGHYGQGVNRPLVLRGVQTRPDFSYQALHLAHFFSLCAARCAAPICARPRAEPPRHGPIRYQRLVNARLLPGRTGFASRSRCGYPTGRASWLPGQGLCWFAQHICTFVALGACRRRRRLARSFLGFLRRARVRCLESLTSADRTHAQTGGLGVGQRPAATRAGDTAQGHIWFAVSFARFRDGLTFFLSRRPLSFERPSLGRPRALGLGGLRALGACPPLFPAPAL